MKFLVSSSLCVSAVMLSACGKDSGGFSDIPALAPLVQLSLPSSLQAGSASVVLNPTDVNIMALGSTHLTKLFKTGGYAKISGGTGYGYINRRP